MFYTCIINLCFQIKIEIVQINNYKVKKLISLLNNTRMQKVCDASKASLFAKHDSDTRQLLVLNRCIELYLKTLKTSTKISM